MDGHFKKLTVESSALDLSSLATALSFDERSSYKFCTGMNEPESIWWASNNNNYNNLKSAILERKQPTSCNDVTFASSSLTLSLFQFKELEQSLNFRSTWQH